MTVFGLAVNSPKDRFLVTCEGHEEHRTHVTAVIHGQIIDTWDVSEKKILYLYKYTPFVRR